jgi:hypothetical protein
MIQAAPTILLDESEIRGLAGGYVRADKQLRELQASRPARRSSPCEHFEGMRADSSNNPVRDAERRPSAALPCSGLASLTPSRCA